MNMNDIATARRDQTLESIDWIFKRFPSQVHEHRKLVHKLWVCIRENAGWLHKAPCMLMRALFGGSRPPADLHDLEDNLLCATLPWKNWEVMSDSSHELIIDVRLIGVSFASAVDKSCATATFLCHLSAERVSSQQASRTRSSQAVVRPTQSLKPQCSSSKRHIFDLTTILAGTSGLSITRAIARLYVWATV